jgi:hypothetical protein
MFEDLKSITILEHIKLLFVKTKYDYDNGMVIKYKEMNGKLYILKMTYILKIK